MAANRNTGPGFDWLRIGLSILVILLHSFHTAYGSSPYLAYNWSSPLWAFVLPAFFGLSGFLVTGSAIRTSDVRVFLWFRGLRIVPALAVEVTISALILGPLVTTVPLGAYFSDPMTLEYFGNVVGWVHYALPGVFESNPRAGIVNQNLWTLHPELMCYAAMAACMIAGAVYSRRLMTLLWIVLTVLGGAYNLATGVLELSGTFPSEIFVYSFITGVVMYHWKDHIPLNRAIFVLSLVTGYIVLKIEGVTVFALPMVYYVMIYIGMTKFPRIKLLQSGDYSYGVYLYGYPIQQTIVFLLPDGQEWWTVFVLASILSLMVAAISWWCIEKPALRLKNLVQGRPKPIPSMTEPPLEPDQKIPMASPEPVKL